jgi:hypothetical protein
VRVAAGQQLFFSSPSSNSNAGLIDIIGAPASLAQVEFFSSLANAAVTGQILTEGTANLRFDSGMTNDGKLDAAFGQTTVFGNVTNNADGTIKVEAGTTALFTNNLTQNGALTISPGGALVVEGAFTGSGAGGGGSALMEGAVQSGNAPSLISFGGNTTLASTAHYEMQIGGATAGTGYSTLSISGLATLSGSLDVSLAGGFQPTLGETFTALTFGSRSGDFTSYKGLAVGDHLTLQPTYVGNSLILTARPTVNGDFNLDGIVNIQDIAFVASHWLQIGPAGDMVGAPFINAQWIEAIASNWLKTDTGGGAGDSSAVPEPSTLVLTLLGGLALLACRRRTA